MRRLVMHWAIVASIGCGAPIENGDGSIGDGSLEMDAAMLCARDGECDDGVFCNGAERCSPGDALADARGCAPAAGPRCPPPQTCDETAGRCESRCDVAADADGDGHDAIDCGGDDCDDSDVRRWPGNGEICDSENLDEDCNPLTFGARDTDSDGHVDAQCCNVGDSGTRTCGDDCDDSRSDVVPGALEACDLRDNDCDASIDEEVQIAFHPDGDGDGFGSALGVAMMACSRPSGYADNDTDCDDTRAATNPGAPELCNGVNDDCDAATDEGVTQTLYRDADGDGFGTDASVTMTCPASGLVALGGDCNDGDRGIHPGASEICNGMDDDCDSVVDDDGAGGSVCACSPLGGSASCGTDTGECSHGTWMCTAAGWTPCSGAVGPIPETCDGRDNDCDGSSDELPDAVASCTTYPNSMPICAATGCSFRCNSGFGDCDGNVATGCEARFSIGVRVNDDQVDHCGACGTNCIVSSNTSVSSATCSGTCGVTCATGHANCNTSVGDGCEIDTTTNLTNCGACGRACTSAPAHGTAVCTASACSFTCQSGYYRSGSSCLAVPPPRLVFPMSTSMVTSSVPLIRWENVAPADAIEFGVYLDRACTVPAITPRLQNGTEIGIATLGPGLYYWRARGAITAGPGVPWNVGPSYSPVWQFRVVNHGGSTVGDGRGTNWGSELDVRGDGLADLAIGRAEADQVELRYGSSTGLPASASATIASPDAGAGRFGISVASAGDVNGDGFGDLVVGACGPSLTGTDAPDAASCTNTAYVFLGSALGISPAPTRLAPPAGTAALSGFGYSVASAGDVNGDGYGDVVVGAYWIDRAFVYLGSATGVSTTVHRTLSPPDGVAGLFGVSVATTDVNADHYADVIVGRPLGSSSKVFVFCGAASGLPATACVTYTGTAGAVFGLSVSSADVNGDGGPDVIGGGHGSVGTTAGQVLVFYGGTTPDTTADRSWTGPAGSSFGLSVVGLADFDGDGNGDVAVGAPTSMRTYIFRGNVSASGTETAAWATLTSTTAVFGRYVSSGGSVNGDTRSDLIVGSCNPNGTCSNMLFAYYGQSSAPTGASWSATGTSSFGLGANR